MFANSLGEADIIHEVNIISDSDIICRKANIIPKIKASLSTCFYFCVYTTKMQTPEIP